MAVPMPNWTKRTSAALPNIWHCAYTPALPQMSPDFMRVGFRDSSLCANDPPVERFVRRAAAECKVESTAAKTVESELFL